jgi:hypothetical protein
MDAPSKGQTVLRCAFCQRTVELEALKPAALPVSPAAAPRWILVIAGAGLAFVAAITGLVLATRSSSPAAPVVPSAIASVAVVEAPAPPLPADEPPSAPEPQAPARPDVAAGPVTITWRGRLVSSSGAAPPAGAPCTLTASAASDGKDAREALLTFQCQGQMLYDSSVPLEGMANEMFSLDEEPVAGEALAFRYHLGAEDVGSRAPPRAQIMLHTPKGILDAFRDTAPAFRVHATLDHDSAVRRGKALLPDTVPPFDDVVTRTARVRSKTGVLPFVGAVCRLRISPGYATKQTCRVLLDCAGRVLYGAGEGGFDECVIADRQPQSFVDPQPTPSDGDPELSCDLVAGTATLGDTSRTGATYSVTFGLSDNVGDGGTP